MAEQAAGRAVLKWEVVRRGPVNAAVMWQYSIANRFLPQGQYFSAIHSPVGTPVLTRLPLSEWHSHVRELKTALEASADDLAIAMAYWDAISGSLGYDVRDGKRIVDTFETCAFKSDDGLAPSFGTTNDMTTMEATVRKQVFELNAHDLRRCPIWEFALDEEGDDGQDEATVRPA